MRYITSIACLALLLTQTAWAALPTVKGNMAEIQLLDARISRVTEKSGAANSLHFVYLITRRAGTSGQLTLKEPRDARINSRSYREITSAKLQREFEPITRIHDATEYLRENPTISPAAGPAHDSLIITVDLFGAAIESTSEIQTKLDLGFGGKTEASVFTFKATAD